MKLKLSSNQSLTLSLNARLGQISYPHYSGSYSVTPNTETQTLNTSNKIMDNNVSVVPIPYSRVETETGYTVTIG